MTNTLAGQRTDMAKERTALVREHTRLSTKSTELSIIVGMCLCGFFQFIATSGRMDPLIR